MLPHGLINNVSSKLGNDGRLLVEYVSWVRQRVLDLRADPSYAPVLHFDVYSTIRIAFDGETARMCDDLEELAAAAAPFQLRIEHPLDAGSTAAQVDALAQLRAALAARGCPVRLVADEWCNTLADIARFVIARGGDGIHVKTPDLGGLTNTISALLSVRAHGLSAYCGTCNETEVSARACVHVAMACGADLRLAKPGMGVDEGLMITRNEMTRALPAMKMRTDAHAGRSA